MGGECVQTCDVVGVDMGVQAVREFEPEIINYLEVAVNLPQQVSHRVHTVRKPTIVSMRQW